MPNINDVRTTEKYWDCNCTRDYIKPASQDYCWHCDSHREDQPDSIVSEVLKATVEPGDTVFVPANQATRDGTVLAVIGDEALIEYTMPAGTSSLRIVPAACPKTTKYKSVSYLKLPLKWLKAIAEAETGPDMVIMPQKSDFVLWYKSLGSYDHNYYTPVRFEHLLEAKQSRKKIELFNTTNDTPIRACWGRYDKPGEVGIRLV